MALQLAPWLQPPDYLRYIDSGAQLGLGVRRADLEQAAQQQRAQQATAELRQNWAAKMLENQTAQVNRAATRDYQMQNLGLEGQRNLNMDMHNLATEQNTLAGQKQSAATAAAALAESKRRTDLLFGKPGATRVTNEDMFKRRLYGSTLDQIVGLENSRPNTALKDLPALEGRLTVLRNQQTALENSIKPQNLDPLGPHAQNSIGALTRNSGQLMGPPASLAPPPPLDVAPPNQGNMYDLSLGSASPQLAPPIPLTASPAGGTQQTKVPVTFAIGQAYKAKYGTRAAVEEALTRDGYTW